MSTDGGTAWKVMLAALVVHAIAAGAFAWGDDDSVAVSVPPPASRTVLRIARSTDGLAFADSGEVFLPFAAAPDLEVLPNGDVLTVFDYAGTDAPDKPARLVVSRSMDGGHSWTPARRIQLLGAGRALDAVGHGDLVRLPGGRLQLYFEGRVRAPRTGSGGGSDRMSVLRSAATLDGVTYRIDDAGRLRAGRSADVHPMALWLGDAVHLYAAEIDHPAASRAGVSVVRHFMSSPGQRFVRLPSIRIAGVRFVGSLVATDDGMRAYASSSDGIVSLRSGDGRDWEREPGLRLRYGWDPAVIRLKDRTYLMLYCAPAEAAHLASSQLVDVSTYMSAADDNFVSPDQETGETMVDADGPQAGDDRLDLDAEEYAETGADAQDAAEAHLSETDAAGSEAAGRQEPSSGATADAGDKTGEAGLPEPGNVGERGIPTDLQTAADGGREDAVTGFEDWDPISTDGFAPEPNFETRIDYLEWYREYALDHPEDNAFWSYASFMPGTPGDPASKPEWPEFNDMFNGDYDGPPMPWSPAEHPEWEASYQTAQEVLERFREATTHEGYASPPDVEVEGSSSPRDMDNLLIGILLPSLAPHRQMVKATLAAAWRMEDGKVSPGRMIGAWETSLRGANHVGSGATLIEDLVGIASRAMVQGTARWALKHDVFSGDEIETALDTLRQYDRDDRGMDDRLRGEHAMCMDLVQYLYMPPDARGVPVPNVQQRVADMLDLSPEMTDRITNMSPDQVHASINALDVHYRKLAEMVRTGYPQVRAADVTELTNQTLQATPLTEYLLPNLTRYYQLKTRSEASRRATQLAYATRLFKERNGRWPASLDELPAKYGRSMRTDPFTGRHFGYRVTDDGPTIYSASENGLDDGGIHSPRWGDDNAEDGGSDDYVFWPPQPKPK